MEKHGRGKVNYGLINKIERKYENLVNCPEDDKDLQQLRKELNVIVTREYRAELWRSMVKNK